MHDALHTADMAVVNLRPLTCDDGERGLQLLTEAIERNPEHSKAQAGLALMLLSLGHFKEGWPQFKRQLRIDPKVWYDHFPVKPWDGENLTGKNVLVWLDRGIGDQILEASMIPDLAAVAGSVTLLCTRRLGRLFRRSFPTVTVYRVGEPVSPRLKVWDFDCQMSVSDLGTAFRPSPDFIGKPYLIADPAKVSAFRTKYAQPGKRIIGLSWWTKNDKTGAGKSMPLTALESILRWPNATFVSLQYGDNRSEIDHVRKTYGVEIIEDNSFNQLTDIDTFAAQVAAMDGVITSSNSTAHVAGGLGVPGWVLLPKGLGRMWYWMNERADSPWYPSLTLMRQERSGDWASAVAKITDAFQARDIPIHDDTSSPDPRDQRIADLEDALQEFAVFARASEVPMTCEVKDFTPGMMADFQRDVAHIDMSMFYRAAELTRGLK